MTISNPTVLESLASLYLTFGHATDDALSGQEMRTLAKRLQHWEPQATYEELGVVITATVKAYKELDDRGARLKGAGDAAASLRSLPEDLRRRILDDLQHIGAADGSIGPDEEAFLEVVADRLDVSLDDAS